MPQRSEINLEFFVYKYNIGLTQRLNHMYITAHFQLVHLIVT